jgi:ammonia channel protein AmtB
MTSFIYPVVVAWVWAVETLYDGTETGWGKGWLKNLGYVDFAGSSVVHVVGGICSLWGAKILGPRYGKEKEMLRQRLKKQRMTEVDEIEHNATEMFNDEEF